MLRVTVEVVPWGNETRKRTIGTLEIARTTISDDPEDYDWLAYAQDGELVETGAVFGHRHKDGAWELVRRAVECLTGPGVR